MLIENLTKAFLSEKNKFFMLRKNFFLSGLMIFVFFLLGCGKTEYTWGWYVVSPWHPSGLTNIQFLLSGLGYTLLLSVLAIVLSIILSLIVSRSALTKNLYVCYINRVCVEIFCSIPMLVMLL